MKGSSGESVRVPPMWLGFDSGLMICGSSLFLVVVLFRGFSPGSPFHEKTSFLNSSSTRIEDEPEENQLRPMGLPPYCKLLTK